MNKLRVGLLLDAQKADSVARDFAVWARGRAELDLILLYEQATKEPSAFRFLSRLERPLLRGRYRDHGTRYDLGPVQSVAQAGALGLDVIVTCGPHEISRATARAAKLGTARLWTSDGFRECLDRLPSTAFALLGTSGELYARGNFRTQFCFSLNRTHARLEALSHLKALVVEVATKGRFPEVSERSAPPPLLVPTLFEIARHLVQVLGRVTRKALKYIGMRQRWNVSFVKGAWADFDATQARRAAPPAGRLWADPFLVSEGGKTWCFVEEMAFSENKGRIAALELNGAVPRQVGIALEETFHLSFPFLFRHEGALFMCPETSAAGEIRIYRCASFPLKWELHRVIMKNVRAVDSVIFEMGGRWRMLTNVDRVGLNDFNSELFLYSADSPFSDHWTPHPMNPLRVDCDGGRNGGLIVEGGRIFRVGQRQGFDRYGGLGVAVYEITTLTDAVYEEKRVKTIAPDFHPSLLGAHHLSTAGGLIALDHCSYAWRP